MTLQRYLLVPSAPQLRRLNPALFETFSGRGCEVSKEIINEIAETGDAALDNTGNNDVGTATMSDNNKDQENQGGTQAACTWSETDLQEIFTSLDLDQNGNVDW